jgi:S1-C subfamily serine protease
VRGDLLDVILVVLAALFAWSGYRQGFVFGALSFLGFLGGGLLGAHYAPSIADRVTRGNPSVVGLTFVLVAALIGHFLGTLAGNALRDRLTWHPARVLDAVAGGAVSVVSLLLVVWLVGSAVASSSYPTLASQVRRSAVVASVDAVVPDSARGRLEGFRNYIDDRGFPDVFGGLAPTTAVDTSPPDPALAASPAVTAARASVVKIVGTAASCSRQLEGSGFLFATDRVMTNAHVVAGVKAPKVEVDGATLDTTVVLYDPQTDIAVLDVPGLPDGATGLSFAPAAAGPGNDAIVVGYPQDGPFRADAARVREVQRAQGLNIYRDATVTREVYALRARVQPGNSGGPLLDTQGRVLGVVFAAAADSPDIGYALTDKEIQDEAARGATASAPVSTMGCD